MKHLRFILGIIIVLVVIIIIVQNQEAFSKEAVFKINLLGIHWQSASVQLYFIVTIAFLFGFLIAGVYGMLERFRLKKQIKMLTSASAAKEQELNSLRNLPITTEETSPEESPEDTQGP
ncbi:lipopolysaccharide assembly protein LapA domain-containing protein [Thermodesulfobacteriota bacterium]